MFNFVPKEGGGKRFGYLILNAKPREGSKLQGWYVFQDLGHTIHIGSCTPVIRILSCRFEYFPTKNSVLGGNNFSGFDIMIRVFQA